MAAGFAFAAALGSAVCYGAGSVLQAMGVRRTGGVENLDPRLLGRAVTQVPFVAGLGVDALGFVLSLAALRKLPLFAVEAVVAANVAVAAILSVVLLGARLLPREWAAVALVVVGLGLLALSAAPDHAVAVSAALRWATAVAAVVLVVAAVPAARLGPARSAVWLGLLAGLEFGVVGVATRILRDPTSVDGVLGDPAVVGLVVGGVGGFLLYSTALQRGTVTAATAPLVVAETLAPAVVGLVWLGDHARPGWALPAVIGLILSVGGTLAVARYAEPAGLGRGAAGA
jgi:drug/metabolite transporter (DMT)-like permease